MTKVALLIGVSEYEPGLNPLPAAVKDVVAMQRVLSDPEMGGFDQVKPLTNPDPQTMQYEIEALFSGRNKDDLVLLFFSGHGIKDDSGRLYFASRITCKNNNGDLIRSTAVPTSFVHDIMNNSRCRRQAIILDCCFSGAFDPALQAKDDGSVDLRSQLGAEGRVVLTSSSSTEYSFEQQGADLSLYTRYLVEGIETGAGDRNADGFVSMLELHEYAASKVQETAPKMTPKIIVLKDKGFEIVLSKARVTDPKLKYRKAASRHANAGSIRPANRAYLNLLGQRLGLTPEEAEEIEADVLRPYQERLANLQNYREALIAEAEFEYPLSQGAWEGVNRLQEFLGLRDVDVAPIQQEVEAQFFQKSAAYQQHLAQYEQAFAEAIHREFPLSQQTQQDLENLQRSLELSREDTIQMEKPLFQQAELRHQEKLRQVAEQQRQEQERVEYEKKLRRYKEEFSRVAQADYPLSQAVLNGLKNFRQQLELKDEDVEQIEQPIYKLAEAEHHKRQEQKRAEYEDKLRRYEQAFPKAVQEGYPLDFATGDELKRARDLLGLRKEDVAQIEHPILQRAEVQYQGKLKQKQQEEAERERQAGLEKRQKELDDKLRRYEQELSKTVRTEYPLSSTAQANLQRLQASLGLTQEAVIAVNQRTLRGAEARYQSRKEAEQYRKQQEAAERERRAGLEKRQKAEYDNKLRRYEQELSQAVQKEYPLSSTAQANLQRLQASLGLTQEGVIAVHQRILRGAEARYQSRKEAEQYRKQQKETEYHNKLKQQEEAKRQQQEEKRKQKEKKHQEAISQNDLGIALYGQGKLEEAIAAYGQAIRLDPNLAIAHYNLGISLDGQGKSEEAITAYRQAIQLDPNDADSYCNLGNALRNQGKLEEAIAAYRQAIQLDPNLAIAHCNLGSVLKAQGKLEEAITAYRQAIRLDHNLAIAHNNLGNALSDQGKLEEAIAAYRQAIQLDPNYANSHCNLGNALYGQGKLEEAITALRQAIQLDPNYANSHNSLGAALYGQGKLEEAITAYRQAIQLDPNDANSHNNLEVALKDQSQGKKFLGLF